MTSPGLIALAVLSVLAAACTGDGAPRSGPSRPASPSPTVSATELPTCATWPGGPPPDFIQVRERELRAADHVGVREEYRDPSGRVLVYLLGVPGEIGEGATVEEEVALTTGGSATLLGTVAGRNWAVVWDGEFPCERNGIVGNGFGREEFAEALESSGVLEDQP